MIETYSMATSTKISRGSTFARKQLSLQCEGAIFFLDGPGESSKTFVYSVLLASVQRDRHVAIGVTSSSIVAFLLEGG
jgi:hypothetical protein